MRHPDMTGGCMEKVLGLGDNVCDVYLHTGIMYPGGQALNFAAYARKLDVTADFMGVLGTDKLARHITEVMDLLGIGHGHCRTFDGENGFACVTLENGDRVFKGSNRGGVIRLHPVYLDEDDFEYVSEFSLIHTTNNGFIDNLLPELKKCGVPLSYDFSYRWNEDDRVARVCPHVAYAFLSCSDLGDGETKQLCERLHKEGCQTVIATRGALGATAFDGTRFYMQEPDYVTPVDTMGAGDAFATQTLLALLQGAGMPEALKKAAAFSANVCLTHGAFGHGVPVPDEVKERIGSNLWPC